MKDKEEFIKKLKEIGIIGAISDAISIQDTDYKILYQNQAGKDFIGDHVGKYCYKAYKRRDHICEDCALAATFNDGEIHTTEKIASTDKGIEHLEITASPLRDSTGEIVAGIEIIRNITERKRIEEVLMQSEEKFRLSFENAKDAIFWGDTETGLIIKCNKAAEDLLEKKREEIIGHHQTTLHPPQKSKYYTEKFKEHIAKKGSADDEAEVITKSGKIKPVHITASVTSIRGKQIIQGIFQDITERKKIEEVNRMAFFYLDSVNDTVIVLNAERVIIKVNKEFSNLWGYSSEEVIGKPVSMVLPEEEMPKNLSKMKEAISLKKPLDFETVALTKSGEKVPLSIRGSAIFDKGRELEGFIGIFRDITERKQIEEALQKAHDELEKHVEERTTELKETNTALKVLLKQLENDRKDFEKSILSNIKHLILPYIAKLKKRRLMSKELSYLNILESNLKEIVSPFSQRLSSKYLSLTPQEIKIADLIKDGIHDKDMAENLNISVETVKSHRQNIRKKLGIYSKRANLRTRLLSLTK